MQVEKLLKNFLVKSRYDSIDLGSNLHYHENASPTELVKNVLHIIAFASPPGTRVVDMTWLKYHIY